MCGQHDIKFILHEFFILYGILCKLKSSFQQVLMIDDRNNVQVRHVNVNNRFSESVPDYEDVKVSVRLKPINLNFY